MEILIDSEICVDGDEKILIDLENHLVQIHDAINLERQYKLFWEAWYLRLLMKQKLNGQDLMYFCPPSKQTPLIAKNLTQYQELLVICQDELEIHSHESPSSIILNVVPTCSEWIILQDHDRILNSGLVWEDELNSQGNESHIQDFSAKFPGSGSLRSATASDTLEVEYFFRPHNFFKRGRFIDRIINFEHFIKNPKHGSTCTFTAWTRLPKDVYEKNVIANDRFLKDIWIGLQETPFNSFKTKNLSELVSIRFTGNERILSEEDMYLYKPSRANGSLAKKIFFEVEVTQKNANGTAFEQKNRYQKFLDSGYSVAREAEDRLRVSHGLPRIGEGWYRECEMQRLIESIFVDAERHAKPAWLKPQHFDSYVEACGLAFEYNGIQHYQPVEYFGGEIAFKQQILRDQKKSEAAKKKNVALIVWKYDENISLEMLIAKIAALNLSSVRLKRINELYFKWLTVNPNSKTLS